MKRFIETEKNNKYMYLFPLDSSCTGGSIYTNCGPACKQTCSSWNANEDCSKPCVPGCHCPAGFVWHNEKCVPPFQCFA